MKSSPMNITREMYLPVMVDSIKQHGGKIRLGVGIERVEEGGENGPVVVLESGERIEADIVVGADGESFIPLFFPLRLSFQVPNPQHRPLTPLRNKQHNPPRRRLYPRRRPFFLLLVHLRLPPSHFPPRFRPRHRIPNHRTRSLGRLRAHGRHLPPRRPNRHHSPSPLHHRRLGGLE